MLAVYQRQVENSLQGTFEPKDVVEPNEKCLGVAKEDLFCEIEELIFHVLPIFRVLS